MKKVINLLAIGLFLIAGLSTINKKNALKYLATNSYKVIRVNGKIVFVKTNSIMKHGDLYVDGTDIDFSTSQSRAAIINKLKGRCVLSPAKKGKAIVLPAANNINSRAGAINNALDIKNNFSGNFLVINKVMVEINKSSYPQNENNFFYLAYEYKGELIHKKLSYNDNKLILDRNEILTIDNEKIPAQKIEMTLYYMNNDLGSKLAEFTPVFPVLTELKSEIQIILTESEDKPKAEKVKEVTAYLNEFYGKPNKENLNNWLSSGFEW